MVGQDFGRETLLTSSRHFVRESGASGRISSLHTRQTQSRPLELVRPRSADPRSRRRFGARLFRFFRSLRFPRIRLPQLALSSAVRTWAIPGTIVGGQSGFRHRIRFLAGVRFPFCDLALIAALPLALLSVFFLTTGPVPMLTFLTRVHRVELIASNTGDLMATAGIGTARNLEDVNLDATQFEQIQRFEYVVQEGDTISEIAYKHGLKEGTLLSLNPGHDVRRLLPGTVLSIPDRDGVLYAIGPGDTLSGIADSYDIAVESILDANDLDSTVLEIGEALFLPGAEMESTQYLLAIGELFHWPTQGRFTSGYGMRVHPITGIWHMHTGIDLANRVGTRINAASSGRVVYVDDGSAAYGKMVIIDHGMGFRTLYGHLHTISVRPGQYVETGQMIGAMGNTGRSTGSHLHFSVIRNGLWVDPLDHMP